MKQIYSVDNLLFEVDEDKHPDELIFKLRNHRYAGQISKKRKNIIVIKTECLIRNTDSFGAYVDLLEYARKSNKSIEINYQGNVYRTSPDRFFDKGKVKNYIEGDKIELPRKYFSIIDNNCLSLFSEQLPDGGEK